MTYKATETDKDVLRRIMSEPTFEAIAEAAKRENAAMNERERIKAILIEHEPLAGAYVHDLIRAIDED